MDGFDHGQLAALRAAVDEGSFDTAAARLAVTPSAISQRIRALETLTGCVLVVRARPVRVTPAGEVVLRLARQVATATDDALAELGLTGDGSATVALGVNADSLETWLPDALARVEPPVRFDLVRADERQTVELLRRGAVSAAVTSVGEAVPGCRVEPLGRMRYRTRASPGFVARWFPHGGTPEEWAAAPVVEFDREDRLQGDHLLRRAGPDASPPRHHVPGTGAYLRAVQLGMGWGTVPDLQFDPRDPSLMELDPGRPVDVALHWQCWRRSSPTLEAITVAVRAAAGHALLP